MLKNDTGDFFAFTSILYFPAKYSKLCSLETTDLLDGWTDGLFSFFGCFFQRVIIYTSIKTSKVSELQAGLRWWIIVAKNASMSFSIYDVSRNTTLVLHLKTIWFSSFRLKLKLKHKLDINLHICLPNKSFAASFPEHF